MDGRLLVPIEQAAPSSGRRPGTTGARADLSPVALVGAAAVLLGSVLPWWTWSGADVSAWDMWFWTTSVAAAVPTAVRAEAGWDRSDPDAPTTAIRI